MQPNSRLFVSVLRSPVAPFDRSKRRTRTVSKSATFLATESVNSAPFKRGETKGSSVIFEVFLNPYSRRICLDSPPPPDFSTQKSLMGIPKYTCTSMYLNTHTSFMQGHSSTPLPFTTTTSLTTTHCATFIELFLLEHLRCFFVTDDRQRRVFLSGKPSMTVLHSGRRPHFARVHVDLRQQGFFSLADRLARDERL